MNLYSPTILDSTEYDIFKYRVHHQCIALSFATIANVPAMPVMANVIFGIDAKQSVNGHWKVASPVVLSNNITYADIFL